MTVVPALIPGRLSSTSHPRQNSQQHIQKPKIAVFAELTIWVASDSSAGRALADNVVLTPQVATPSAASATPPNAAALVVPVVKAAVAKKPIPKSKVNPLTNLVPSSARDWPKRVLVANWARQFGGGALGRGADTFGGRAGGQSVGATKAALVSCLSISTVESRSGGISIPQI